MAFWDPSVSNSGGGSQTAVTGLTTSAMTASGQAAYISSASTVSMTDAAAIGSARCVGFYEGTSGSIVTDGQITDAKFSTAGGAPTAGNPVYLELASVDSNTAAGKLTATAPSVAGQVVAEVGICQSAANYAGAKTCVILIQIKPPIVL